MQTRAQKNVEDADYFKNILYTKRLFNYLRTAPEERATIFAEKIIRKAVQRKMNNAFLHESKHAIDNVQGSKKFIAGSFTLGYLTGAGLSLQFIQNIDSLPLETAAMIGTALFCGYLGLKIGYKLDLKEVRAKKFASEFEKHPRFGELVQFNPI
ncbi:MAG: hypothetical protein PHQ59_04025 [Candidatus Daviesbacteria bacterium]|nr:hypothetical protein [Candidatus Daviesbacteria bacterium]